MEQLNGHNIQLTERKILEMTGIADVSALSPDAVEMTLAGDGGCVGVDGDDLKIDSFSSETGKIRITGEVAAITYYGKSALKKGGLFKRKS